MNGSVFLMLKKRSVGVLIVVVIAAVLAACYFLIPRSVISDPDHAAVTKISILSSPIYQEDPIEPFVWVPETEEDQAIAKEIAVYLSQCQERRTLRTYSDLPPYSWRCMYIEVNNEENQDAQLRGRLIVLGPRQGEGMGVRENDRTVNLSERAQGKGIWGRFQGRLTDPDSIRTFVLEKLGLPENFM